jgi:hypothetical protein
LQASEVSASVAHILSSAQTLYNLHSARSAIRAPNDRRVTHVQGRSRRRHQKHRTDFLSDEEEPELSGDVAQGVNDMRDLKPGEGVQNLEEDLQIHVGVLKDGVNQLANEGGYGIKAGDVREAWGILAFALEDWQ